MAAVTNSLALDADKAILTDDDRFFIISALNPLGSRWRNIGNALGLPSATLDTIRDSHQGNLDEAIDQVVCKWLALIYNTDKFPRPSWDALVKAVANRSGGNDRRRAQEIATEHPPKPTDTTDSAVHPYELAMSGYDWFHGKLRRAESEARLHKADCGCFLIRESMDMKEQAIISLRNSGGIHHFIIKRGVNEQKENWYEVDGTFRQFFSIPELVKYYEDHNLTQDVNDKLDKPCPK